MDRATSTATPGARKAGSGAALDGGGSSVIDLSNARPVDPDSLSSRY
jgi:hypothetical protein